MSIYRRPGGVPVEPIEEEPSGIVALWERTGGRPDPRCIRRPVRAFYSAPLPTDQGPEAALVIYAALVFSIAAFLLAATA